MFDNDKPVVFDTIIVQNNDQYMKAWKLQQWEQESAAWKRSLYFMQEETILLKNRLTQIPGQLSDRTFIQAAENYQDRLIKMDEMIAFLRKEIAQLDHLLVKKPLENGLLQDSLAEKMASLRKNFQVVDTQFDQLKNDFNGYFSSYPLPG
jgi:hypothetical protein